MLCGAIMEADAEALNISVPKKTYQIPAGDLSDTLPDYAAESGILLGFDPGLTQGKRSPALKGQYGVQDGFDTLLKDSGLEVIQGKDGRYQLRRAAPKPQPVSGAPEADEKQVLQLNNIEVRAKRFYEVGPLPGLGLTKEQIPGNVQSLTAQDIKEAHALSLTDLMNSKLQSVNVNDYQGNPFQMDVQYRGFTAGPQIGTPQGLSVFFDGIRINEPFGDVVNWDLIPLNALSSFDVFPGSNPIFGLGTLGGALSMKTKDGFNNKGASADILTGSFGRKQLQLDGGWNNGTIGLFAAGNFFLEDGWRENSPSKVNQIFAKANYRGDKLDLSLNTLIVQNDLVGNGLIPSEMYAQDRNGVYTSPDTTKNTLAQFQLSGSYFVNDNFTITAQAYRRNSKRKTNGADVYTEYGNQLVRRNLNTGEQFTCLFNSTNDYGLPDYYLIPIQNGDYWGDGDALNFAFSGTIEDAFATLPSGYFNQKLPDFANRFLQFAQFNFNHLKNFQQSQIFVPGTNNVDPLYRGEVTNYSDGKPEFDFAPESSLSSLKYKNAFETLDFADQAFYFYTPDTVEYGDLTPGDGVGVKHLLLILPPSNADNCQGDVNNDGLKVLGPNGRWLAVDGAANNGTGTGYVEGTPTAILTETQINQETDGASMQFNWNFEKHKFMVGASVDIPSATYTSGQMLGMLDAERRAYLSPDEIRDQYAAASTSISNNNFNGHQVTKSIYASETWSPIDTLHFTGALRYNDTYGKNKVASRTYGSRVWDLAQLEAFPDYYDICRPGESCPTGYTVPDASNLLNKPETEKFNYYSLNPSLGTSWQATKNLNIYGNWAQGTRVPSVVELGCAFDKTPIYSNVDGTYIGPKSLVENRFCSLPTTLSGDPYLPQIKAQSWDLGLRGKFSENIEWNVGVYRTNLKDDIYMIGYPGNRNFFDTIGETRRQGLEAGMTAVFDQWRLRFNYALTEATFQNSFYMPANDNSSGTEDFYGNQDYSRRIQVKPGDRMPGVPLHNLNATLSYQVTPAWQVGLTAVAHSFAYVRGNENNEHRKGVTIYDTIIEGENGTAIQVPRRPTNNPGTTPGYMTFNLQTSYKLNSEWTLGLRVNNIFDKEYFSAGRLGRNPFSPSVYGAIGPSGYNHNSSDWMSTNFLAPGAPRGAWVSLTYTFDPNK